MATWNGYPPNPSESGWHWLRHGELTPAYWSADRLEWQQGGLLCGGSGSPQSMGSAHFVGGVEYVAPCVLPAAQPERAP